VPAATPDTEVDPHPELSRFAHALGVTGLVILLLGTGFSKATQNTDMVPAFLAFMAVVTPFVRNPCPRPAATASARRTEGHITIATVIVTRIALATSTRKPCLDLQVSWFYLAAFVGFGSALALEGEAAGVAICLPSSGTSGTRE